MVRVTTNNTAVAPADYVARSLSTLSLDPGQTTKAIFVAIAGDTLDEENETFFVDLKNPTGAKLADNRGIGRITDDDLPPALSISNAAPSFVCSSLIGPRLRAISNTSAGRNIFP